jgi:hypothetical protein
MIELATRRKAELSRVVRSVGGARPALPVDEAGARRCAGLHASIDGDPDVFD